MSFLNRIEPNRNARFASGQSTSSRSSANVPVDANGLAVAEFKFSFNVAADYLFGRDAINPLPSRAHKLDIATGNDEGFEVIAPHARSLFR
jgi:hypothetical protein